MEPQRYCTILRPGLNDENLIPGLDDQNIVMPGDSFKFNIKIYHYPIDSMTPGCLLYYYPSQYMPCLNLFQEGQEYFSTLLRSLPFYVESPEDITERVMSTIKRRFYQVQPALLPPSCLESPHRNISFTIIIVIFDMYDFDPHAALVEESMQNFRMIPASNEAIETSLKKFKVMTTSESCCPICLEDLDINDECCTMPCNHMFHSHCIVTWLQTSHVCALCRYPLPTV